METKIVLSRPFSLETQSDPDSNYKAPNILRRILRFISVVAWNISTVRPLWFGVAPYNPTLGETHHVSKGNLNVLLEQVSHHPPVSALHATDDKENIEIIWCHSTVPKFTGTSVEARLHGKRQLKLHNYGETYEMNAPNLLIRIFPVPGTDWVGDVTIRTVRLKNTDNGEVRMIYDAKEVISGLQTPIVKDPESVWPTESALVWSELSQAIMNKDWEKATEAKKSVGEKQRELRRERESKGKTWIPKHFMVSYSKQEGWDCSPIHKSVPNAPIVSL